MKGKTAFTADISDLVRVTGKKPKPGGGGGGGSMEEVKDISDEGDDQDGQEGEGDKDGDQDGQEGEGGSALDDKDGDKDGKKGGSGKGKGKGPSDGDVTIILPAGQTVDTAGGGDMLTEEEAKQVKQLKGSDKANQKPLSVEELKKSLEEAKKTEQMETRQNKSGQPGKGFGGRRVGVPADYPTKTDWARALINLLNKETPGPATWAKPHTKTFGMSMGGTKVMIPGRGKEKSIGKFIAAIDTSGSINDAILNGFLSDLRKAFLSFQTSKTFGCKIILWADGPYEDSPVFKATEFEKCKNWVSSHVVSGGTSITPVINHIDKNYKFPEYVGVVWFTDGEVETPPKLPDMFNIFVINGFISGWVKTFLAWLKTQKPKGKPVDILRTKYGFRD
jgi:hypothetical protein